MSLAKDEVGAIRQLAFESLGDLDAAVALPLLIAGFDDRDMGARQAAVQSAARVAPEEAKQAIVALLEDLRPDMRFQAVVELARLRVSPELIAAKLSDGDPEVRAVTARSLAALGARSHCDDIARLLDDSSSATRVEATLALAALGDRGAIEPLRHHLMHRDTMFEAASALGELQATEATEELAALASRTFLSPIIKAAAAGALVRLGDRRGTETLRAILRSWRIEARSFAIVLAGELELVELADDLVALLQSRRRFDRSAMKATLTRLAPQSVTATKALESLAEFGDNRDA